MASAWRAIAPLAAGHEVAIAHRIGPPPAGGHAAGLNAGGCWCVGQGMVIQAPQTGEDIEITPFKGYWQQNVVAVRRVA